MKKINKWLVLTLFLFIISIFSTGCTKDEMDGIEIGVTNYANEYIVNRLYKNHSKISSIYPDGVDNYTYKISNKLKKEYAKKDIFIYNGLIENERNLALDLLEINKSLKIIDTAYVLETEYAAEELWLNPSSLLMMSQNVKNGLEEYIASTYLQKEIEDAYKELKIDLSTLDVEYRETVNEVNNKSIVIEDSTLKFLEKFGLNVYCIDNDATEKTLTEVEDLITNGDISYIITFRENEELSTNAKDLMAKFENLKIIELHKIHNLTDKERDNHADYLTIMRENLELLSQELYQ